MGERSGRAEAGNMCTGPMDMDNRVWGDYGEAFAWWGRGKQQGEILDDVIEQQKTHRHTKI